MLEWEVILGRNGNVHENETVSNSHTYASIRRVQRGATYCSVTVSAVLRV